jgi:hypothetical protein
MAEKTHITWTQRGINFKIHQYQTYFNYLTPEHKDLTQQLIKKCFLIASFKSSIALKSQSEGSSHKPALKAEMVQPQGIIPVEGQASKKVFDPQLS